MAEFDPFVTVSMQLRDTLGRKVRERRLALKMSQRDLAAGAGVRQALVSERPIIATAITATVSESRDILQRQRVRRLAWVGATTKLHWW